jgi:pimeloyl-ACP methyl ester carboxylesterase
VYGFHSSSKIALECARRYPSLFAGLVCDGLALPPQTASADYLARYLVPFEIRADGSHLAGKWTLIRDFHRYFPHFAKGAANRLPLDEPGVAKVHVYCMDTLMAGPAWTAGYGAALRYDARPALAELAVPCTFMARADDVLVGFLDALPQPPPPRSIVDRVPAATDAWREHLRRRFREYASGLPSVVAPAKPAGGTCRKAGALYLDLSHGQLHGRLLGQGAARPVLMLHEAPGSSRQMLRLQRALAADGVTLAIDLPGTGESSALPGASVERLAAVLLEALDALGWDEVDLYAEFTSSTIAVELANLAPGRVHALALDGLPPSPMPEDVLDRYAPPIRLSNFGSHLTETWHQLRDLEISWPWFDRSATAGRRHVPDLDAQRLHDMTVDVLKQHETYGEAAVAALRYSLAPAAARVARPVLVFAGECARGLATRAIATKLASGSITDRPASAEERARTARAFWSGADGAQAR